MYAWIEICGHIPYIVNSVYEYFTKLEGSPGPCLIDGTEGLSDCDIMTLDNKTYNVGNTGLAYKASAVR